VKNVEQGHLENLHGASWCGVVVDECVVEWGCGGFEGGMV
jgi:hypothetical protein